MEIRLVDAVRSLAGNNTGFDIDNGAILNWDTGEIPTGVTQPTVLELSNEVTRLEAAYDALEYSRLRKAKYDLLNQDEMRYDDVKNSTTTWVDAIDAIKAAHPKP
jgi:hypothetical protein